MPMKATTLSISIPTFTCNKSCPYCISKMTGETESDFSLMMRNIDKVINIADRSDVNTVSFTGKGEILASDESIKMFRDCLRYISAKFSCELQTNGITFSWDQSKLLDMLYMDGLDTVAISIDHPTQFGYFETVFRKLRELGMTIRATVNLTPSILKNNIPYYISVCKKSGIHQLSFREITVPNYGVVDTEQAQNAKKWIEENIDAEKVRVFIKEYNDFVLRNGNKIHDLPYGTSLYDVEGITLAQFDYCIQDTTNGEDIRSLIFHEDGHLSPSWYGSNVGRIL